MESLDALAEDLEELANALIDENEDVGMRLQGGTTWAGVLLEIPIWDSESDERAYDEDGPRQTVSEFTLDYLEDLAADILNAVGRLRRETQTAVDEIVIHVRGKTVRIPIFKEAK